MNTKRMSNIEAMIAADSNMDDTHPNVGSMAPAATLRCAVGVRRYVSVIMWFCSVIELVNHKTGTEFGLKPGGFRWHYVAGIGNIHKLLH